MRESFLELVRRNLHNSGYILIEEVSEALALALVTQKKSAVLRSIRLREDLNGQNHP